MESLGINPVLLVAQIISFTILYFVLKKYLYGRIQSALSERREAVHKTFTTEAEIEKRLATFTKEQEEKQRTASEEVRRLILTAREEAEKMRKDILEQAASEGEQEVARATARITRQEEEAKKQLEQYVKELSREMVEKAIADKSENPDWQKEQVANSVRILKNGKGRSNDSGR